MKRLAALAFVAFLAWSALPIIPAGANSVANISIACDSVAFSWSKFPERPVDLRVTVEQGDASTHATVSTDGAVEGEASVPVDLDSGNATATVEWTLRDDHSAGPVTADLDCSTTTTTTPSTTTPTTEAPTTTTVAATPPAPNANECGPGLLACTGGDADYLVAIGGIVLIGGMMFVALTMRPRRSR